MYNQTQDQLVQSDLYPALQSVYRAGHSTETALLKVYSDILINMDNQRVTLLVLLDLSSAFDTVDHKVLPVASKQLLALEILRFKGLDPT